MFDTRHNNARARMSWTDDLWLDLGAGGYGKPAAHAEGFRRDFEDRRGLLALVLGALDQMDHVFDDGRRKTVGRDNLRGGFIALDVGLKDGIENFVGRQRVRILLAGAKLG